MDSLFYIGQKVVALANYEDISVFKKGDEFTVLDIRKGCCTYEIKIFNGRYESSQLECGICGKKDFPCAGDPYFRQERFAPIREIGDMTFEEAIELVSEPITINN